MCIIIKLNSIKIKNNSGIDTEETLKYIQNGNWNKGISTVKRRLLLVISDKK